MVGRSVVFRFFMDIREFVQKGRQAVKVTNDINQSTQRASGGVRQLESSMASAGRQSAASAVNFQTMTQGMLNLSTAGVQTFTSMSNLDRAGNRLAQSQIAVARAQDLLNNKQLRLNELMAAGGAHTQKATNLTNELATARGDLLVKTDKLKIEEGALRDIQLLFVTNIANVMISSIQTITTLRNADILTTIRQTATNKLLSLGLLTQTKVYQQNGIAIGLNTLKVRTAINVNRLLTLSLPVVGVALVAVTLLWEAYTENLGGFRDMVQETLPFMKDQKQLLRDVQGALIDTTSASDDYNSSVATQSTLLFKLPDNLRTVNIELEKIRLNYEGITKSGNNANQILSNTSSLAPPNFRSGVGTSQTGTTQTGTINGSNVISHEGDTRSTANAVNINGLIGFAGGATNAQFGFTGASRTKEFTNQAGNRVTQDAKGNQVIHSGQGKINSVKTVLDSAIETSIKAITHYFSEAARGATLFGTVTAPEILRSPTGKFFGVQVSRVLKGYDNIATVLSGFNSTEERDRFNKARKEMDEIVKNNSGFDPTSFSSTENAIFPFIPNRSGERFTGVGLLDSNTGGFFGTKSVASLLKTPENERSVEQKKFLDLAKNNIKFREALIRQDIILASANIVVVNGVGGISQEDFFENFAKSQSAVDLRLFTSMVNSEVEAERLSPAVNLAGRMGGTIQEAQNRLDRISFFGSVADMDFPEIGQKGVGLNSASSNFVDKIGSIAGTLSSYYGALFSLDPNSEVVKGRKPIFLNIPEKVKQARIILEQLKSGDLSSLSDETNHDRLVSAAFGATHLTNFPSGGLRGFEGDVQGFVGGGLRLSNDDPRLVDTSGFGSNRLAAFNETGFDIGAVADSISKADAMQLALNEKAMSRFANTSGGQASDAIAQAQRNRAFELGMHIATPKWIIAQNNASDAKANRLRRGGPNLPEGVSARENIRFIKTQQTINRKETDAAFGFGLMARDGRIIGRGAGLGAATAIAQAGLSFFRPHTGGHTIANVSSSQIAANLLILRRAGEINILNEGFGLSGFIGSSQSLLSLQGVVADQDALIKSIGLNRSQAFNIIDTDGRGRNEIDDRLRWHDKLNAMSTGTSPL